MESEVEEDVQIVGVSGQQQMQDMGGEMRDSGF